MPIEIENKHRQERSKYRAAHSLPMREIRFKGRIGLSVRFPLPEAFHLGQGDAGGGPGAATLQLAAKWLRPNDCADGLGCWRKWGGSVPAQSKNTSRLCMEVRGCLFDPGRDCLSDGR